MIGVACAAFAVFALAPTAVASANDEDCVFCHEDLEDDEGRRIAADLALFSESVHGELGLGCIDCHTDADGFDDDHPQEVGLAACGDCHEAKEEVAEGSHAGLSCEDCHGSGHALAATATDTSATSHFHVSELCASCHEALGEQASQYEDSIHGRALSRSGLTGAPSCLTCHGAHEIYPADDSRARVYRTKVVDMCGSCHEGLLPTYSESVHAGLGAETGEPRAVCSDCHLTHSVGSRNQAPWRAAVVNECGECHVEMLESFSDGFHGQATLLGFERVAKCGDCHGFHDIREIEDPLSRVAESRVVETCRTCHEEATANWADYDPHADLSSAERNPQAYYAKLMMGGLLAAVFSFFFLHTALWLPRALFATRSARAARLTPPPGGPGA
jgi:hypothetical protein